ncbi:YncE family protein [Acidianus sp.]|uniref:YncE family protein n=1 Tax=Acidianus sp. TaxID=1872104 RepID=UPI0039782551
MVIVNKILIITLVLLYVVSIISIIPITSATQGFKTTNISVGSFPTAMAYDSNNGYVYVVDSGSGQVSVISSSTVIATISVGSDPTAIVYDKQNGLIYVANTLSNSISIINRTEVIATVTVGGVIGYSPVALLCVNGLIYVANLNSYKAGVGIVSVINGTKVVCNIQVECHPVCLVYDPSNGYIYVSDTGFATVSVIKGEKVIATISVGQAPRQIIYDPYNGLVYVLNLESNSTSVINGTSVICTISVPYPVAIAYSSSYVYIVSLCNNTVYMISGTKVVGNITVGQSPVFITYDSYNGLVYVANLGSNSLSVINSSRVIYQIPTGNSPRFILATPSAVYVADSGSNEVTEISVCKIIYYLTFKESGLPVGKSWTVCVNGTNETSTSNEITFILPPGMYFYKVYSAYYIPSPPQGSITLSSNATLQISFTPVKFNLTFEETGLVSGTKWAVCVNGTVSTSTSPRICFLLPYGYYEYKVLNVTGYKVTPIMGYIDLTSNTTIKVAFYAMLYNVTFKETGLPKGVSWSVCIDNENHTTTACYITITLPMGVYEYKVFSSHYMPNVTQGTINLTMNKVINIKFTVMNYTLTIFESGLPSGYEWTVNINGSNYTTTMNEINITLPYGEYMVKVYSKYYMPITEEEFVNLSKNTELQFTFVPENFTITFEETGLPSGTTWTVCIDGRNYTTTSSSLTITLPYGTYEYRIFVTTNGYSPNVTQGTLTLTQVVKISITYKQITTTSTTTTSTTSTTTPSITTTPPPTTVTSPTLNTAFVVGIAIVVVIVIAAAIILLRRK